MADLEERRREKHRPTRVQVTMDLDSERAANTIDTLLAFASEALENEVEFRLEVIPRPEAKEPR